MFRKNRKSTGQATVEYLLIIVVAIFLMKAFVTPMGKIFANWTSFLLGPYDGAGMGYYGCLMENGLLPGGSDRGKTCPNNLQEFDISAFGGGTNPGGTNPGGTNPGGTNPGGTNPGGTNPGGTNPDGTNPDGTNSKNSNNQKNQKSAAKGKFSTGSSKKNSTGGSSGNRGSYVGEDGGVSGNENAGYGLNDSELDLINGGKKKRKKRFRPKKKGSDDDQYGFQNLVSGKRGSKGRRRIRVKRSKGFLGSQFYEEEAEERPTSFLVTQNSISKDPSSGEGDQNKGLKINKGRETSSKKIEEEIKEMDFGKFLKYFFFIAIIIAVIVLIGSQILEFQNAD